MGLFRATIQPMTPTITTTTEQQWQQARALLSAGKAQEALPFLELAADALHAAASFNLGCLHLFSLIAAADKARALPLIRQAAELGHGGAFYQLTMIELSKPDKVPDWQYANECLRKSAERGYPSALRSLAVHWSRNQDESLIKLGTLCLEHAAQAGDIVSLCLLMHRIYAGIGCEKNIIRASAINTLLMHSPLQVDAPATPGNPELAQAVTLAELPTLPMPQLQNDLWHIEPEMLCESPWIGIADNIANAEECYLLRYTGVPHLNPSITAAPDGQRMQVQLRTSFDMVLEEMLEDINLLLLQRRMAMLVDTTPAYSEYMQLLRYQEGQEYRPHRDYLPPSLITPLEEGGAGQRESTVIIYLNDVENGGETEFIELHKKIAPKMGRILAFKNLHPDGSPDTRTLHAGLPVKSGAKWIGTLWIHQGVFRR
jgi:prolyl 4-hydroxylase